MTGFIIGAWGFLWTRVLTTDGHIFDRVPGMLPANKPDWVEKVLFCPICHSGQVALWFGIITERSLNPGPIILAMLTAWFFERLNAFFDKQ